MTVFQIFEYVIGELRKLDTSTALRLEMAVEERCNERRLKDASTLLAYLRDPQFLDPSYPGFEERVLQYSEKKEITKFARDVYIRLFYKGAPLPSQADTEDGQNHPQGDPNHNEPVDGAAAASPPPPKKSRVKELAEKLDRNKRRSTGNRGTLSTATPNSVATSVLNAIKNDMKDFEVRGQRPTRLADIYRALLSIPATSVEAER